MPIDVSGVAAAVAALKRVPVAVSGGLAQAVHDEAADIRRDEQAAVPVRTGELQAGIEVRPLGVLAAEVGIFDTELFWAIWIEWGRSSAPAQPFATPAAEQARGRWPKRAADAARAAVGDA